jgi:hypothetical protein
MAKPESGLLRVGVLFRGDPATGTLPALGESRLRGVGEALAGVGLAPEAVVYSEERHDAVQEQVARLDGVLVWVDPMSYGRNRNRLDELLREAAASGVWVSSHPDLIKTLGTKEVLARTQAVGWTSDTSVYRSLPELREGLAARLAAGERRVLKPNRGNGGIGVRRVELADTAAAGADVLAPAALVRVQAAARGSVQETMALSRFFDICVEYFDGTYAAPELVVDQPYQERLGEGMVRCYLVQDRVAGFGHQMVTALLPPPPGDAVPPAPPPRLYYGPDKPEFQTLKERLEFEWLPAMLKVLGLNARDLPAIWDADFLYGPRTSSGEDTWVLCETNISAVLPFPDAALAPLAACVHARLSERRRGRGDTRLGTG